MVIGTFWVLCGPKFVIKGHLLRLLCVGRKRKIQIRKILMNFTVLSHFNDFLRCQDMLGIFLELISG